MERCKQAYEQYIDIVKGEIVRFLDYKINYEELIKAVNLIINIERNKKRVHVTGIGKPSHVATYIASLLSSVGTPAYFLNGTEAVHGSSGQCENGDIVICISNSGETMELIATVKTLRKNGCKIIGVTGNYQSYLAKVSDVYLFAGVEQEGGPLNRAPRASVLVEMIILQQLSVMLQAYKEMSPQQYIQYHPGGSLGKLREGE